MNQPRLYLGSKATAKKMNIETHDDEAHEEKLPSEVFGLAGESDSGESGKPPSKKKPGLVEKLLMIAEPCKFWQDHAGVPCVSTPVSRHFRHYRVMSGAFENWLRQQYYADTGLGLRKETLAEALATLAAKANYEGVRRSSHLRVGFDTVGDFWLDLCDEEWSAVRVSILGWRRELNPEICFLRHPGMEALPEPKKGGSLDELWRFVNCRDEDRILVAGFLMNALHPNGPYFGLNLYGGKGSAKTTATRVIRSLVDPNEAFSQSMPTNAEDFAVAAQGQRILSFENLSKLSPSESDWLCRLSTGDAIRRRKLYADSEETIFRVKAPWIINSIPNLVTRGDLIDRALSVELLPIDRSIRREERVILDEFQNAAPGILGALLEGIEFALKSMDEVRAEFNGKLPRMADMALWITAAEPALGFERGTFLRRHQEMATGCSADSVEENPVAKTIIGLADEGWEGTTKELWKRVKSDHPEEKFLPKSARDLGSSIDRISADLMEGYGVRVEKLQRRRDGIPVRIRKDVHQVHDVHQAPP